MIFKGVIFDLDGTLLNSVEDIADSLNFTLQQYGLIEQSVIDVQDWIGEGAIELVKKAVPAYKLNTLDIQKFLWEYRERYEQNFAVRSYLYEDIPALLDELTFRNVHLNILSNKPHELTTLVADHFLVKWRFDNILGMRDGIPRKPDPAAAIEIVQNLGLNLSDILYIGDSSTDIETARNAGVPVLAIATGVSKREDLEEARPTQMLNQLTDLLTIIDGE